MATPTDLSKLETLSRGQIYNEIATYQGFDPSKLETLYMGELFYGIGPGGEAGPETPTYNTSQMFAIF